MGKTNRAALAALALVGVAYAAPAGAQSMTPMIGKVRSIDDAFAVRVFPKNPYRHRIRVQVRAYDHKFRPVRALISPSSFTLGGGNSRPVVVQVPFNGAKRRKVRICTESIPFPNQKVALRAQICGRFLAERY